MKVLLYDNLFYYTIVVVMHIDMQELMWAASVNLYFKHLTIIFLVSQY